MKKIMKRFIELSIILVLCLFAAGVANAESYAERCYEGTCVPDFGRFASYELRDVFKDEEQTIYLYDFDTTGNLITYRDYLDAFGFTEVYHTKYENEEGWCFVNIEEDQQVIITCYENVDDPNFSLSAIDSFTAIHIKSKDQKNKSLLVSSDNVSLKRNGKKYNLEVTLLKDESVHAFTYNGDIVEGVWVNECKETDSSKTYYLYLTPKKAGVTTVVLVGTTTLETKIVKVTVSDGDVGTQKVTKKLPSATTYTAKPGLGKGTWKTSNSSIVSLSQKKGSTCTFKLKKAGKAKVTFKSDIGTYVYNITVYNKKSDPIRAGFIEMNSADGIEPTLFIANNSGKSIKYVDFNATFYNAVGDKVRNDIGNSYSKALQIIGPIKPWTMDYFKWDPVFYSPVVKRMYVKSAAITYMDGSKKTVSIRKSFTYSQTDANKYYKYI